MVTPTKKRKMDHNPILPLNPIRGERTGFRCQVSVARRAKVALTDNGAMYDLPVRYKVFLLDGDLSRKFLGLPIRGTI